MSLKFLEFKNPYCDWEALRNLTKDLDYDIGVYYRYRAAMGLPTEPENIAAGTYKEGVEITPLSETRLLTIKEARQIATLNFAQHMEKDFPRGATRVFLATELNKSLTSKFLKSADQYPYLTEVTLADGSTRAPAPDPNVRPMTAPLNVFPALADYVLGMPIHKLFFGEPGSVTLPTSYSIMAGGLPLLEEHELNALIISGRKLMDAATERYRKSIEGKDCADLSEFGQICGANEVLYERIKELAEENPFNHGGKQILSHSTTDWSKYKISLAVLSSEENRDAKEDAYEPTIDMVMFFALESGQALDYFIRNDYINVKGGATNGGRRLPMTNIYRRTPDGKELIEDAKILQVLSFCIALKGQDKAEFNGLVLKNLMEKGFVPAT